MGFHACQDRGAAEARLGELEFTATGAEGAQDAFKKGLLLLHSFEFDDAADEFRKVREVDEGFVMAYWGEAMTYNHPLWRFQDREQALEVLGELAASAEEREAMAVTEIEKDFMRAVHVLYGDGTKAERDQKYAAFMGELYEKYPGNDEVASFYSLSLIGSVVSGRDDAVFERAAAVAKEVIGRNPNHPGALHYLIHAYDDPVNAAKAIPTADVYAKVAPSAGHALHMPSHIYLAMGMWEQVVQSNEEAWAASYERKTSRGLENDEYDYHAFHWLMYGYLQTGEPEKARECLDKMIRYCDELPSERARAHKVLMRSTYAVEMGAYDDPIYEDTVALADLNIILRGMDQYVQAQRAYLAGDESRLQAIISELSKDRYFSEEIMLTGDVKMCGGSNSALPNELDVNQTEVMELEIRALLARLQGKPEQAYDFLQQAVDIESKISYAYGPPTIVKPAAELMGDWALLDQDPAKAAKYYTLSLEMAPGRLLSAEGKAAAGAMRGATQM